jgi:hypothetical protein
MERFGYKFRELLTMVEINDPELDFILTCLLPEDSEEDKALIRKTQMISAKKKYEELVAKELERHEKSMMKNA